jgi:tripartite-type tricarboxylate transporter receptor subunit TctC
MTAITPQTARYGNLRARASRFVNVVALLASCWAASALAAEQFPARPVRMLIPFPAGGPADFVGRLFAQNLTELWGTQVVADNRAGASASSGPRSRSSRIRTATLLFGSTSTFAVNRPHRSFLTCSGTCG